ncbi:hypothetical protein [Pseudoalteromonas sp. S16_S37]|uniref:hypothetical protein n=1 Tax=Pseudoalteromonas sp. S16_S37 TaxID=2720228 RepID=UPI0016815215|nr:hypothetical protein [Pseudoalteromonas sp. S16_S37]MBD1583257.1 hypothetical protein [Pseudoalteromonas sp. S16_S37]
MADFRSVSQILFGFLPEQTVDLRGQVWKVKDWVYFTRNDIDDASIRRAIIRQASAWEVSGNDGGFIANLRKNYPIKVVTLDEDNGVQVESFPSRTWVCRSCFRIHKQPQAPCPCGTSIGTSNLYFVGFHNLCGAIREPYIPSCEEHKQVRVRFPGTATASEIIFDCPVCNIVLRKGFGNVECECKQGYLKFLPHRAASVYTPHNVVIVNPPDKEKIKVLSEAGGPPRALSWVLNGMIEENIDQVKSSSESLRRTLQSQGLPEEIIDKMLEAAGNDSSVMPVSNLTLNKEHQEEAEAQAVILALATLESRIQIKNLIDSTALGSQYADIYRKAYVASLEKAKLKSVELIDKFPILTAQFGYTRGGHKPGEDKLTPFKTKGSKGYTVYSDLAQTEALYIQLDPIEVISWLKKIGYDVSVGVDEQSSRENILKAIADNESPTEDNTLLENLHKLVHSYAHRFVRIASVFSGIDRNGLSELLVPYHLGFFIYGAAKGDFVLGGLQAVFETELHHLLDAVVFEDHRCAMDPACSDSGGACMGCLHLGEPSCRHFNMNLSRSALFGRSGYLR